MLVNVAIRACFLTDSRFTWPVQAVLVNSKLRQDRDKVILTASPGTKKVLGAHIYVLVFSLSENRVLWEKRLQSIKGESMGM